MYNKYDIIIVGAGPSGLTLAKCFSSLNKKVLILDREQSIGGCHRVKRVFENNEMLFTEHGPRIYSNNYINTAMILEKLGTTFSDVFTPYNFSIFNIGNETLFSTLNISEVASLALYYFPLLINSEYGNDISMKDFMNSNGFSEQSIRMIDRICRTSDGADISRYTLNEFYNLLNQNIFYRLHQPNLPNDIGLFKIWQDDLKDKGVDFSLNTTLTKLNYESENNRIKSINIIKDNSEYEIDADKIILAIPPKNIVDILQKNSTNLLENETIKNAFGNYTDFKKWSRDTEYIDYVSITFHWNKKLKLENIYGFSKTSWELVFIVLSNYMKFSETTSETVISVAISNGDLKSDVIGKTANECYNKTELIDEIFRQLSLSFPGGLEKYSAAIISPNTYYKDNKWMNADSAYISSSINPKTFPFKSSFDNLYTVGTHTGKSFYKFTSMESAVTNSLYLAHDLFPELKNSFPIKRMFELNDFIKIILVVISIVVIIYFLINKIKIKK